jgi:hypothetical protein
MAKQYIFRDGTALATVPASSKVAIFSVTPCKLYKKVATTNYPEAWVFVAETTAGTEYVSTAFSAATEIRIEAGAGGATYDIGTVPSADVAAGTLVQGAPTAETTAATLTIAELLTKIVTGTHAAGATQAYTLPTGTLSDAGAGLQINEAFDWSLINLSAAAADTITLTAGADHTIVGNPIVQSAHASTGGIYGNSAMFRTRKTAANAFVTYRIA